MMAYSTEKFSRNVYLYGSEASLPQQHVLRTGPLEMVYEEGNLRYIRWGEIELLRMIYSAVRDHNWGTAAPQIPHEKITADERSFSIAYDCAYQEGDIHFFARYSITGDKEGKVTFSMDGEALSSFKKNRIGFCILHPASAAELPCRITTADEQEKEGKFPKYISPHQPFMDLKKFAWQIGENTMALLEFEGDIFEMEDQRNWTDASYKTYCTPLALPFPVQLQQGDKIQQKVTLSLQGDVPEVAVEEKSLEFIIPEKPDQSQKMPLLGVGKSSEATSLSEAEFTLLQKSGFSHYRTDLKFYESDWQQTFLQAIEEARRLHLSLEIALFFKSDIEQELTDFLNLCANHQPDIKYVLLFHADTKSTRQDLITAVLPHLREKLPGVAIGAGTDHFFTELNRERTPVEGLDFITYSINPQVHQFDNLSLIETLEAQSYTVESTRQFADGLPIHVSPVTFRMRNNPNATGKAPEVRAGELPPQVDVRQMSLFGAVWTLGSLKYLAEAGVAAITYYETVGMRGLMQGSQPPTFQAFKAVPHQVFPLYFVFRELVRYPNAQVVPAHSSNSLEVDGLVLQTKSEKIILLGNMQAKAREVTIRNIGTQAAIKMLDEQNVVEATLHPEVFSDATFAPLPIDNHQATITLPAYALAVIK